MTTNREEAFEKSKDVESMEQDSVGSQESMDVFPSTSKRISRSEDGQAVFLFAVSEGA